MEDPLKMPKENEKSIGILKKQLKRHFPILTWLPSYKKSDLVADFIAGLTLGLTMIPQSVAYASLAGIPGEYGLYSCFIGGFLYCIFGTVKEVSIGPASLLALLTLEFTRDLPIEFVFLLTFVSGCVEFLFGLFQFGFLVNFISGPVTVSFQTAASLIIISSQLKDLFGVPKFKSGKFLDNIYKVGERISQSNWGDITLSIACCTFLLSLRKLNDLQIMKTKHTLMSKKILKKAIWFLSISRNAVCVLISCFVAYAYTTTGEPPFKLSGHIPSGLPEFRPPMISWQKGNETVSFPKMIYEISPGFVIIPLISILASMTTIKAFSAGSVVDATQEMLALGICNMSGALFGSLPTCGALTRSAIANSSGVRTPLAGLFTGTLIILVIQYLTPYFYYIPRATLASVLICAVMFLVDFKTLWLLWKINKLDFGFASVTFFTSLLFGIQTGTFLGIGLYVAHLLYMWARPSLEIEIKTTPSGKYYYIRPDIGLFFPANDFLQNEIIRRCVQNIPIVIDCLHFKGMDFTTAQGIKDLGACCKKRNQKLVLANVKTNAYLMLKKCKVGLDMTQLGTEEEELNDLLF